ncbi:STM4015 family protein [Singulisphaera sp. Ch08]|uniref:STM4015 family protein n=1 Tax=Singulisphaera sp. Ch08 TaxID=3120278 RepID=A0AAU7CCE1_9BACT
MTVDDHAEEFVGLPVRDYDPEEGIADPAGSAYRLSFSWNDTEEMGSFGERLALFLEDPNASQVRGLIIGAWQGDDSALSSESIVEALVAARAILANLRGLFLGDITSEENEISWIEQSDVTPLFDAFPALEQFRVRGGTGLVFGKLRHANLRSLVVESGGLDEQVVRGIAASELPVLEHLELWLGTEGYGRTAGVADLAPILQGDRFPALRYLGLRNCADADEIAKAVAQAPVVAKIKVLDLSLGDLGDEGALAIAGSPDVAKLESLDIHHHFVSDEALAQLKGLGITIDASERMKPYDWRDEDNRYIAVSE